MRSIAVVQARMGSSRLPGKVLRSLNGKPMVIRVIERVARAELVEAVVAAIPMGSADDELNDTLRKHHVSVVRGPSEDVLARYRLAAEDSAADVVLRVTGDCPLISPAVCDRVLEELFRDGPCDYASNTIERTYPRGLDAEAIARNALDRAAREATQPWEREHVTPYIWQHPDRFVTRSVVALVNHSDIRLTVDTDEDFQVVSEVYRELDGRQPFDLPDVLALIERRPELLEINRRIVQKQVAG